MAVVEVFFSPELDGPFLDVEELIEGKMVEVDYFSQRPFICSTDTGSVILGSFLSQGGVKVEAHSDPKEPMNIYSIAAKDDVLALVLESNVYLRPGRGKRPPRTENKGVYPWGYYQSLEVKGELSMIRFFIMSVVAQLGRVPFAGFEWSELTDSIEMDREEIEEAWTHIFEGGLKEAEGKVAQGEGLGVETDQIKVQLAQAKKYLNQSDLTKFCQTFLEIDLDHLNKILEGERKRGKELSDNVLEVQNLIRAKKELGFDLITAEHYLQKAKSGLRSRDFDEVQRYIDESKKVIDALQDTSRPVLRFISISDVVGTVGEAVPVEVMIINDGNLLARFIEIEVFIGEGVQESASLKQLAPGARHTFKLNIYPVEGGMKGMVAKIGYSGQHDNEVFTVTKTHEVFLSDPNTMLKCIPRVGFHAGHLRLDVNLHNGYPISVSDVTMRLSTPSDDLELTHFEPQTRMKNNVIELMPIEGGKVTTQSFFYEVLRMGEFSIKGVVTYRDSEGKKKNVSLNSDKLTLKEMAFEVNEVPSGHAVVFEMNKFMPFFADKVYNIPLGLPVEESYQILRHIMLGLPSVIVTEYHADERTRQSMGHSADVTTQTKVPIKRKPIPIKSGKRVKKVAKSQFLSEAWFYLTLDGHEVHAVVQIRVAALSGTIELFAASTDAIRSQQILMHVMEKYNGHLIEGGYLQKDEVLKQMRNAAMRERVRRRKSNLFSTLEDSSDLLDRIYRASRLK